MNLVEMKARYGRQLLKAIEQLRPVLARVDLPVACCISGTHPLAEAFHEAICPGDHPIAACRIFAEAITGITSAAVIQALVRACPLTAPLEHLFAPASGATSGRVVFWCADDGYEIADLRADAEHQAVNTWGWRGQT